MERTKTSGDSEKSFWWAGISYKYPRRRFSLLGKYGIFRAKNEAVERDFSSPGASSDSNFDFGRAISMIPDGSLHDSRSEESTVEAMPITLESCLKETEAIDDIAHHDRLIKKDSQATMFNLSSADEQAKLLQHIDRNKEYFENLRKCYDLADHVVSFSPLYLDRARSEEALKQKEKGQKQRNSSMPSKKPDLSSMANRRQSLMRDDLSWRAKRENFQRSASAVEFTSSSTEQAVILLNTLTGQEEDLTLSITARLRKLFKRTVVADQTMRNNQSDSPDRMNYKRFETLDVRKLRQLSLDQDSRPMAIAPDLEILEETDDEAICSNPTPMERPRQKPHGYRTSNFLPALRTSHMTCLHSDVFEMECEQQFLLDMEALCKEDHIVFEKRKKLAPLRRLQRVDTTLSMIVPPDFKSRTQW